MSEIEDTVSRVAFWEGVREKYMRDGPLMKNVNYGRERVIWFYCMAMDIEFVTKAETLDLIPITSTLALTKGKLKASRNCRFP